jgi:hypothetical protein
MPMDDYKQPKRLLRGALELLAFLVLLLGTITLGDWLR